jgi:hypothetical protein
LEESHTGTRHKEQRWVFCSQTENARGQVRFDSSKGTRYGSERREDERNRQLSTRAGKRSHLISEWGALRKQKPRPAQAHSAPVHRNRATTWAARDGGPCGKFAGGAQLRVKTEEPRPGSQSGRMNRGRAPCNARLLNCGFQRPPFQRWNLPGPSLAHQSTSPVPSTLGSHDGCKRNDPGTAQARIGRTNASSLAKGTARTVRPRLAELAHPIRRGSLLGPRVRLGQPTR